MRKSLGTDTRDVERGGRAFVTMPRVPTRNGTIRFTRQPIYGAAATLRANPVAGSTGHRPQYNVYRIEPNLHFAAPRDAPKRALLLLCTSVQRRSQPLGSVHGLSLHDGNAQRAQLSSPRSAVPRRRCAHLPSPPPASPSVTAQHACHASSPRRLAVAKHTDPVHRYRWLVP